MSAVAESDLPVASRRRRPVTRQRVGRAVAPYALMLPALVVLGVVLAYPLYKLGEMSFQQYGLTELLAHKGKWIGTANYAQIFHSSEFWHVLLRTVAFTAVAVGLTMVTLAETADAPVEMPQRPARLIARLSPGVSAGPPNGPAASRVSSTR